jgi:enoyl-CoA hydratase/carnithine racemase
MPSFFQVESVKRGRLLRLHSADGMNRLTRRCVLDLTEAIRKLAGAPLPLVIAGNAKVFSVGADLNEIARLSGPEAYEFSKMGQALMSALECFPSPVFAALEGYCIGGGLDLALACHHRIASPHAIFGHRGAALGLVTGWGGTQRLPRLIGKARALQMFVAAERVTAQQALSIGLVDGIAQPAETAAIKHLRKLLDPSRRLQVAEMPAAACRLRVSARLVYRKQSAPFDHG